MQKAAIRQRVGWPLHQDPTAKGTQLRRELIWALVVPLLRLLNSTLIDT
jgi:hypothetical protein